MMPAKFARDLLRGLFRSRAVDAQEPPPENASKPLPVNAPAQPQAAPPSDPLWNFFAPVFWWTSDPNAVTEAIKKTTTMLAPGHHFADNLLCWGRNMSMFGDAAFVAAWKANVESESDQAIVWRRYVLACAAHHCLHLDGDFVECGAYTGVGVKTVVDYLGGTSFPKTFWAYDLFEHDESMTHHAMPEHGRGLYDRVRAKFASYPQVRLLKGSIPEVFASGCPERVAYLHIDLNEAPAEIASLAQLFDRIVAGGIVILDDYEWSGYRAQKLAEDEWFATRDYRVMPLPTGQGLVFKR